MIGTKICARRAPRRDLPSLRADRSTGRVLRPDRLVNRAVRVRDRELRLHERACAHLFDEACALSKFGRRPLVQFDDPDRFFQPRGNGRHRRCQIRIVRNDHRDFECIRKGIREQLGREIAVGSFFLHAENLDGPLTVGEWPRRGVRLKRPAEHFDLQDREESVTECLLPNVFGRIGSRSLDDRSEILHANHIVFLQYELREAEEVQPSIRYALNPAVAETEPVYVDVRPLHEKAEAALRRPPALRRSEKGDWRKNVARSLKRVNAARFRRLPARSTTSNQGETWH